MIEQEIEDKVKIFSTPLANKYTVYINDVVDPEYFNELFYHLENCSENDVFEIIFNSFGGNLETGIQLYNEIAECKGRTVGCVSGYCCSAGTMAMLACDVWSITKTSKIMVHAPSGFTGGKLHELRASSDFEDAWTKDFYKIVYKDFLTEKEIQEVLNGKDFWFNGVETTKRLEKVLKARK